MIDGNTVNSEVLRQFFRNFYLVFIMPHDEELPADKRVLFAELSFPVHKDFNILYDFLEVSSDTVLFVRLLRRSINGEYEKVQARWD